MSEATATPIEDVDQEASATEVILEGSVLESGKTHPDDQHVTRVETSKSVESGGSVERVIGGVKIGELKDNSGVVGPGSGNLPVRVGDLTEGYELEKPIFDQRGVLLLAEGQVITPRFKELLVKRDEDHVKVNEVDVAGMKLDPQLFKDEPLEFLGSDLTQRLDEIISTGSLFVKNNGPSLRDTVVIHGRRGYDLGKREELIRNHEETAHALDNMMKSVLVGKSVSSNEFSNLTGTYLTELTNDMDQLMMVAAEAGRNQRMADHCLKMSMYGMALGVELGYDEANVKLIGLCAMVHDWGLVKLPLHIRNPQQRLNTLLHLQYKKHPTFALEMLQNISGLSNQVALVCYQIHEQPNGKGYPKNRKGHMIHPFAHILHVSDAYVELISTKPWRPALMASAAMEALVKLSGEGVYDTNTVRCFLKQLSLCPIGSYVKLSNGEIGRVIRRNGEHYAEPFVKALLSPQGTPYQGSADDYVRDLHTEKLTIVDSFPTPGREEIKLTPEILDELRR